MNSWHIIDYKDIAPTGASGALPVRSGDLDVGGRGAGPHNR